MKKIIIFLSMMFFMGCATVPAQKTEPTTLFFRQPFDKVWGVVVKVVSVDNDLSINVIEKESGIINTDWVTYTRPPKGVSETMAVSMSHTVTSSNVRVRYKIRFVVEKTENGTKVFIREHVERFLGTGWSATNERPAIIESIISDVKGRLSD